MRRRFLLVAVLAPLIGGAVFLLAHNSGPQPFHLRIVRHAIEQGKPVVHFRVEGGGFGRIQINLIERTIVESNKSGHEIEEFQQLLPPGPISVPNLARKEFGVFVPTNAAIWKLTVTISKELLLLRLRAMPDIWRLMRKRGFSVYQATKNSWQSFTVTDSEVVESEPITNSIPNSSSRQ